MLRSGREGLPHEEPGSFDDAALAARAGALADDPTLSRVVESQIIPRLLIAHCGPAGPERRSDGAVADRHARLAAMGLGTPEILQQDIERLAEDAIRHDAARLLDHVEGFIALGTSVEALLTDLLAPVARRLGEWWEADLCDFVDVTMALWRLQEVTRELVARVPGAAASPVRGRHALFSVAPGESHMFGVVILEACFRRAGWVTVTAGNGDSPTALVAQAPVDLVGLSASTDAGVAALPAEIAAIRRRSCNPNLKVLVGGPPFVARPDLVDAVGADATAADARVALSLADRLCRSAAGVGLHGSAL